MELQLLQEESDVKQVPGDFGVLYQSLFDRPESRYTVRSNGGGLGSLTVCRLRMTSFPASSSQGY